MAIAAPFAERGGGEEFLVAGGSMRRVITPRKIPSGPVRRWATTVFTPVAAAPHRFGQHRRRLRVGLEGLEVVAVGNVEGRRRPGRDQLIDVAVAVEQGDVAEIGQHAGPGVRMSVCARSRPSAP